MGQFSFSHKFCGFFFSLSYCKFDYFLLFLGTRVNQNLDIKNLKKRKKKTLEKIASSMHQTLQPTK